MNQVRGLFGDFFDVHAAFAGRHDCHFLGDTVDYQTHIELFLDVCAFLDEKAAHHLARRPGLMGNQLHTENLRGVGSDFVQRFGHLDAAALAAATGMNLRLDHPHRAAEFLGRFYRLLNRESRNAARHWHTKLSQDFLALVFVNFHEVASRKQR